MTERTLNDMRNAMRGEPLSQVDGGRREAYLKDRLLDVNRTVMGQMTDEEAATIAANTVMELGDTFPASLTLEDLGVIVRAGVLGDLIGNAKRPTPANILAWTDRYLKSPERKREFVELQAARKWAEEHKDEVTREDINERDFDIVGKETADIWDGYVRDGHMPPYRDLKDTAQYMQTMVHKACYRWLKVAGLVTDGELTSKEERCLRSAGKLRGDFDGVRREFAAALMLEWTFLDAVKAGRDLGAEIRRELGSWTQTRKRSTKRVTTFADATWW